MGWDFRMEADVGGPEPLEVLGDINYTYNVAPMYIDAMGGDGIRQLDGLTGSECFPLIDLAIKTFEAEPAKYEAMNPDNGWGDSKGALLVLRDLREWCEKAPKAIMRVY